MHACMTGSVRQCAPELHGKRYTAVLGPWHSMDAAGPGWPVLTCHLQSPGVVTQHIDWRPGLESPAYIKILHNPSVTVWLQAQQQAPPPEPSAATAKSACVHLPHDAENSF